jgi:hypothetical protein
MFVNREQCSERSGRFLLLPVALQNARVADGALVLTVSATTALRQQR